MFIWSPCINICVACRFITHAFLGNKKDAFCKSIQIIIIDLLLIQRKWKTFLKKKKLQKDISIAKLIFGITKIAFRIAELNFGIVEIDFWIIELNFGIAE